MILEVTREMNYEEKYQKWISKEDLDPTLKAELLSMDETAKEDAFYTDVEFGTAGMRGILGAGTNRLNIYVIQKANVGFAKYIASYLKEKKEELRLDMIIEICLINLRLRVQRF